MKRFDATTSLARVHQASSPGGAMELDRAWWGFGGVHGGLVLSLLTTAMQASAQDRVLRQVSGQFRRAVRGAFTLDVRAADVGKTLTWLDASALEGGRIAVGAQAVFASPNQLQTTYVAPLMPTVVPPEHCPIFTVPRDFVPFARHTEIRPVGDARPFNGGAEPELVAWLRLVEDDRPPDEHRLVVLMDALAPSYAAVLHAQTAIPTVAFTVTPGSGLATATSPWLLLRARTEACKHDGWLSERLDAWAPDGSHLGSGEQLRLVINTTH